MKNIISNAKAGLDRRLVAVMAVGAMAGYAVVGAGPAGAVDAEPSAIVTSGISDLQSQLLLIAAAAIAAGAIFLAIRKGWSMVRRFV